MNPPCKTPTQPTDQQAHVEALIEQLGAASGTSFDPWQIAYLANLFSRPEQPATTTDKRKQALAAKAALSKGPSNTRERPFAGMPGKKLKFRIKK